MVCPDGVLGVFPTACPECVLISAPLQFCPSRQCSNNVWGARNSVHSPIWVELVPKLVDIPSLPKHNKFGPGRAQLWASSTGVC